MPASVSMFPEKLHLLVPVSYLEVLLPKHSCHPACSLSKVTGCCVVPGHEGRSS